MKIRSLLFALSALAMAAPAVAQEAPEAAPYTVSEDLTRPSLIHEPGMAPKYGPSLLEETGYFWLSRHFTNPGLGSDGVTIIDSNRTNLYMPWDIGIEIRGFGQMFAPGVFYSMFSTIPNDTSGLLRRNDEERSVYNNEAYYEQFKDARGFTIDTIRSYWFKNWNAGTPLAGAKFYVFRSPAGTNDVQYFNNTATTGYRTRGVRFDRNDLPIVFEGEMTPEGIDTTLAGNSINPVAMGFDPPLAFEPGTFALPMFINDDGEAVASPDPNNGDVRDFQVMAAYWDRRHGNVQGYGTNQGWKNMGLTIFRPKGEFSIDKDTIYSIWRALQFGTGPTATPAHITMSMEFQGTVDINAGVKYHYGREATSQGLGSVTPNPAVADARIPFTLTEITDVSIDLFDVNGAHVRSIAQSRYVPGIYSAPLNVGDLQNGTYLIRMIAGQNVYSMKVTVAK
jgi:hypothetical protein